MFNLINCASMRKPIADENDCHPCRWIVTWTVGPDLIVEIFEVRHDI